MEMLPFTLEQPALPGANLTVLGANDLTYKLTYPYASSILREWEKRGWRRLNGGTHIGIRFRFMTITRKFVGAPRTVDLRALAASNVGCTSERVECRDGGDGSGNGVGTGVGIRCGNGYVKSRKRKQRKEYKNL